ncbi:hypothetical protein GCM10027299_09860 [Larkinella ripae]
MLIPKSRLPNWEELFIYPTDPHSGLPGNPAKTRMHVTGNRPLVGKDKPTNGE